MKILENPMYLGDRGSRTLFNIEAVHGKDIKAHSFYKKEDEILLLPGIFFEVTGSLDPGNGLHIISLKQKRAPFVLLEAPFPLRRGHTSLELKKNIPSQPTPRGFLPPAPAPPPASKSI
jgi:hypothetical protein